MSFEKITVFLSQFTIHKYIFVGIITVLIDYSGIFLFFNILKTNYIVAVIMGFVFSNIFQFYANFHYTFSLTKGDYIYKRMMMYIISALIGIFIGTITIVFIKQFIESLYVAKTLSLFVSFIYGYTASKYVVFKKV